MPAVITVLLYIVIFLFGIVIGSFLNVCIYRIPAKESLIPNSHCMNCGHRLRWYDLFPLFSYMLLKGRCRYCGVKLSPQYPLVELCNGILYVTAFMAGGYTVISVLYCLMASALLVISVIDERTFEIPPQLNVFLLAVGILVCIADRSHLIDHLIGLVCVSAALYLLYMVSNGAAIGGGDIKLMASAGLILGWQKILLAFFAGCILGSVIHMIRIRVTKAGRTLAMGPYLAMGIYLAALWGDAAIAWYFGLLT